MTEKFTELIMNDVKPVGPRFSEDQMRTVVKVLDFTSQVWINCEDQTNMFHAPCGSIFSKIAVKIRNNLKDHSQFLQYPSSLFYSLGLTFADQSRSERDRLCAEMSILFIKWGHFVEDQSPTEFVDPVVLMKGLGAALRHLETVKRNQSSLMRTIECGYCEIEKSDCSTADGVLHCLVTAASSAETYANTNLVHGIKVAESHLVGITLRSIYQAFKLTSN